MKHIVLIGLSGSGKTTLGELAAARLGMPFIDTDSVVEKKLGMPIWRVFELHGEKFFRDAESRVVLETIAAPEASVIATGGGAVLRGENVRALRDGGFVVFLDRPPEMIADCLPDDGKRPLLAGMEKLYEMERERRSLYIDAADRSLRNDRGPEEALSALLDMMEKAALDCEYAVIGDPIAHSLSPAIHGAVFGALAVSGTYSAVRVERGKLPGFFEMAREGGMRGFNVTRPHKLDIIPLLDGIDDEAQLCGAVNTVVFRGDKSVGYNTDMGGLLVSLRAGGHDYAGRNVVILGAGGASRGIALKAAREMASEIVILARDLTKAAEVVSRLAETSCRVRASSMSDGAMKEASFRADILINATPLGMSGIGEDFQSLEFLNVLPKSALVCDLVYDPPETRLLARAAELGHDTQNGLGMLIYQAILADEIFLRRKLDKPALYKTVIEKL
jgi:shikimate dehydrogenase